MTKKRGFFAACQVECWFVMCGSVIVHNIEAIYIKLRTQHIKTVSMCPHYHTATRKMANYNIFNKIPSLAPHKKL